VGWKVTQFFYETLDETTVNQRPTNGPDSVVSPTLLCLGDHRTRCNLRSLMLGRIFMIILQVEFPLMRFKGAGLQLCYHWAREFCSAPPVFVSVELGWKVEARCMELCTCWWIFCILGLMSSPGRDTVWKVEESENGRRDCVKNFTVKKDNCEELEDRCLLLISVGCKGRCFLSWAS
jgi:hypothetical protein